MNGVGFQGNLSAASRYHARLFCLINEADTVNWPPKRVLEADVSRISHPLD